LDDDDEDEERKRMLKDDGEKKPVLPVANAFSNDGSFFEQFKRLQEEAAAKKSKGKDIFKKLWKKREFFRSFDN
jgi:hypothetical protein